MERIILKAIEQSGMTQLELAARSGVPQATLSRFMSDDPQVRRTLTLPVADKLCEALGLELVERRKRRKG
jgi:transcriptional regulator with XRE-family HTH domain